MNQQSYTPYLKLKTNRGLLKLLVFSMLTFGIYAIVFYSGISNDVNIVCRRDGKKTMHYCLLTFIVAPLTFGIGGLVWMHRISNRMGDELRRRNINYEFNAGTMWLWNTIGILLFGLGPFIYVHKLAKAMNLLNEHYNTHG